jgi:hypothetical protein
MQYEVMLVGIFALLTLCFAMFPFSERLPSFCAAGLGIAAFWALQRTANRLDRLERTLSLTSEGPSPTARTD